MTEVTRILNAIDEGDAQAAEQLLPLVYDELRRLAALKIAQEQPGHTVQATVLVHEAYIRLVDVEKARHWDSRRHFFGAAAEAIRRILVKAARRKGRVRHGGGRRRVDGNEAVSLVEPPQDTWVALVEAVSARATQDPAKVEPVNARYPADHSIEDVEELLGISRTTAKRDWAHARAWLLAGLGGPEAAETT